MKAMLDHFGYRWMPHRPAKEMFPKRAVIITQCLGNRRKVTPAEKILRTAFPWWGISTIKVVSFKLMSEIDWNMIEDKGKHPSKEAEQRRTKCKPSIMINLVIQMLS